EKTTSVSKGCFAVKSKRSPENIKIQNFLQKSGVKPTQRWKVGQNVWKEIENSVNKLHSEVKEELFSSLVDFVRNAHLKDSTSHRTEIPTAALVTGVNIPDHTEMFNAIKVQITSNISPYVVVLESKHCSNMKTMMKTFSQHLLCHETAKPDDSKDELEDRETAYLRKKFSAVTMTNGSKLIESSPPKKKQAKLEKVAGKPIVVIFQDLEMFSQNILTDFILMCSWHAAEMPFVFIFGIATSWLDVSQRLLPHYGLIHLSVTKFVAPSASSHLALIIDRVLLTPNHPFKLSGRCLQLILDVFLCHDFSIVNFLHILRFCVLEHFYNQPGSILCNLSADEVAPLVAKFTKNELNLLKEIPSLKAHLLKENNSDLSKDSLFKREVVKLVNQLKIYLEIYFPVLRCLHAIGLQFSHQPLGKQIREVFCACYKSGVENNERFKQTLLLLKVASKDQLLEMLKSCIHILSCQEYTDNGATDFQPSIARDKFQDFVDCLQSLNEDSQSDEEKEEDTTSLETVKYAYQLQEKIRNRAKTKKRTKMTKFEKVQEMILNYLKDFFQFNLRPVTSFPLHEVFYFDDAATITQHTMSAPRLAIQTALADPGHYLNLEATDAVSPEAPDICIAYKLHTESGSIINLYDWMAAFHTIVNETDSEIDEITQARFIRAASELQLLGFIKPTKRKTDHVQRLTWSHS
uniref:Origin recognition complex subunit 3 n=1 Tax=Ciona savignyi TaxID=51511 RepID=H2Z2U2_CIOSA